MSAADPLCSNAALDGFRADRAYLGADHRRNERRTWIVAAICAVTLVAQMAGGLVFRSMALTASGLHMAAHVAALLVASGSYALARRHAANPKFAFGTGKIGYLAGFANAVVLGATAVLIAVESLQRLLAPEAVDYASALPLAVAGLAVTLVCVWLLKPTEQGRDDLNISAAHLHLTADALFGVLAIAGLAAGQRLGWRWADPAAGLAGAVLVAQFAVSLIRRAGATLLDMNPSPELTAQVRARLEAQGERVIDLHLWRLGPGHHAAVAVVSATHPQPPQAYHDRLRGLEGLSHVTVEVHGPESARL
ncbi:MAG: cation diffusion facilitator family transporter [Caulobacterales bacterium]|jgi:cation diffusion facilitator family transporter